VTAPLAVRCLRGKCDFVACKTRDLSPAALIRRVRPSTDLASAMEWKEPVVHSLRLTRTTAICELKEDEASAAYDRRLRLASFQ